MQSFQKSISGINFTFHSFEVRSGTVWFIEGEEVDFFLESSPQGWEFVGNAPSWIQELRPEFERLLNTFKKSPVLRAL